MKVVAIVGTKKTGKTTVARALVSSLARHGRVGTVKNMEQHPVDQGDTRRHFEAGATEVIGLGDARLKVTRERGDLASALAELEADGMNFVVVEGFKHSDLPKIALGNLDVPHTLRKIDLSQLDDRLVAELTELVLGLEDYRSPVGMERHPT
ncbi:MAG: molybdopterin-guanine dinucleotide biosynthesis protein B [Methanotrichaceae archaeon]|nr:molybdopterin-guanine dinucleotide biosynthesis protein B [Methanotrichaceae archaeon]